MTSMSRLKPIVILATALWLGVGLAQAQAAQSDEGAHILALDNSWNRALETNDTKALDLLLADTFLSIDIDGSMETKREFLASLKSPGYQAPAQAITEQSKVDVYGNSAVVTGIFRTQTGHKGKSVARRERFLDTWVKINDTWKCVASVAVLIPSQ
jgi:ketosteroid isomerase-like protein